MKKTLFLALALAMCLSLYACGTGNTCTCDCAQCAQCEKNAHVDTANVRIDSDTVKQNDNVIEFETPVVVAEDEYLRVELVKFYEEYRLWKQGYPHNADSATEGATLEKLVMFKLCNKTDHTLTTYLNDTYLGSEGADFFDIDGASRIDTAAGKNVLRTFLIQTGANTALESMEDLYSLDGDFSIFHKGEDGVMRNNYRLKFSIPDGMTTSSKTPVSDNSDAWKQFRDYLKEQGPVTVITDTSYGPIKTTIEENAGLIQICRMSDGTVTSGKVQVHVRDTTRFDLPANATVVNVHDELLEEGTDENGNRREKAGSTSHTWDIQNYRYGDDISFEMCYSELDSNGNYIQKTGILTATKAYADIADVLRQTLAESGLDVTMADLGFANY